MKRFASVVEYGLTQCVQFVHRCAISTLGLLPLVAGATTVIADAVGDANGHADVVGIAGGYDATNLYLSAKFATGTLDPKSVAFFFALDVDQDLSTGNQPPVFPYGSDYAVSYNSLVGTLNARIGKNFVPIQFDSDSLKIAVPLSFLGNDDGLMNFGFIVGVPADTSSFSPYDWTPDSLTKAGLGGPTSPVPEAPASLLWLAGLAVTARFARRERRSIVSA